jgi:hypothetical protein
MVVARRLKGDLARVLEASKQRDEAIDLGLGIRHAHDASLGARQFQEHLVRQLRNIDGYTHDGHRDRRT